MGRSDQAGRERRRDPRVSPRGRVWARSSDARAPREGRLLDVSAGGLRLVWSGAPPPPAGSTLDVEVRLQGWQDTPSPTPLVLDGAGQVVWTAPVEDEAGHEVGLVFDHPLAVRRPFPDLQVF